MAAFVGTLSVRTRLAYSRVGPARQVRACSCASDHRPLERIGVSTAVFARNKHQHESHGDARSWQVLVIRRSKDPYRDCWSLPGGSVEAGETLLEAAERELREETGLRLPVYGPVIQRKGPPPWTLHICMSLCDDGETDVVAGDDASDARFVSCAELEFLQPTTPKLVDSVNEIAQAIVKGDVPGISNDNFNA